MNQDISISPRKPDCDNSYHAVEGNKALSPKTEREAQDWFQTANVKALSHQSALKEAVEAMYGADTKAAQNPISEAITKSGANLDNPVADNMRLRFIPVAQALAELVEIRMKCLILAGGKSKWGHNLPELWGEIGASVRQEIALHYTNQIQRLPGQVPPVLTQGDIEEDLEDIDDSFIHWKYKPTPNADIFLKYSKLEFINHVLETAMLKYRVGRVQL